MTSGRPFRIRIRNLDRVCDQVRVALRKACPKARVVGVGVGHRRSGVDQAPERVRALKVLVSKKDGGLPLKDRVPKEIILYGIVLGRWHGAKYQTDIEERPRFQVTKHKIEATPDDITTSTCYATWKSVGKRRFGLVTAGHALWSDPKARKLRTSVKVLGRGTKTCKGTMFSADVACASHLVDDGVDVGLVRLPTEDDGSLGKCFRRIDKRKLAALSTLDLENALGGPSDQKVFRAEYIHHLKGGEGIRAVAYWDSYKASVSGWGMATMRSLVEWEGDPLAFEQGVSGAAVIALDDDRGVGIQSFSPAGQGFRRGYGTALGVALKWLNDNFKHDLTFSWRKPT